MTEENKDKWWFPLYEFGVHIFIGVVIFVLIALPAIGLNLWIKSLEGTVDNIIIIGLVGVEYLLFFVDILLFVIHVVRTSLKAGKALWEQ
ncbi:hypothetical protein EXU30_17565 [Shewanella maritima]|uniref:Uncharacterized protein n=1 Tax=Shewanella maritima TaxID=2520507 RepID=A0A411PL77_9GAMM|nr:hypothetical protein [Shewanella maritima]QBF84277.1 hypothetical protein EXU30_17565 [Shewanella maritima]